jgi:hypothetical protein
MAKKPVDPRSARQALETPAARRRTRQLAQDSPDGSRRATSVRALVDPLRSAAAATMTTGRPDGGASTPDSETGQVGTAGTLNTYGYITGEDYNQDLDGYPMFPFYNKMRLGDAQVNATQLMLKLPLKGARWIAKPASDDPQDVAIADFVQHTLIDGDLCAVPWQRVLDNTLLKFDFGCAAEEIVWGYDEGLGAAIVKDLAPRLPRTFYRWVENTKTGQLDYLQQFAPKNGQYGFFNIHVTDPVTSLPRLQLHVRNREGNNYYGRSVMRTSYPHWWWKQQLYRIGMVGADREHSGIARAKLGEKYQSSTAPLDKIETTLKGLRTHDRGYVVQPYGVEYDWLTSTGTGERMQGLVSFIEHHNLMIARNILQSFAAQGEQRHGSFGAAAVTVDVYFLALSGEAAEIAHEKKPVIKALCDLNFDMRGRMYPSLVAADLRPVDVAALSTALSPLATGKLITPDDDLENWLRELFDAPPLPEAFKGKREERAAQPPPIPPTLVPPIPPTDGNVDEADGDGARRGSKPAGSSPELALGQFEEDGRIFRRQPTAFERQVFDLHGVPSTLDDAKAALARQLTTIRLAQLKKTAALLAKKDARPTAAFTDLRKRHLPKPPVADYVRVIRAAQQRMFEYGRQQVAGELRKQGVTVPKTLANEKAGKNGSTARSSLVSSAQITADRIGSAWDARIIERALQLRRQGTQGDALKAAIIADLQDEAQSGAARDAGGEVNEAFGIGRATAAQQMQDLIASATYSALLDANTCESCAELDGTHWSDLAEAVDPPNPDCDGRDSCRCVLLFQAAEPGDDD